MKMITLGSTGIITPQNAFGALPIQRVSTDYAVMLLRRAYAGGMTFFDTARDYTDSEVKLGIAFEGMRDKIFIASKSHADNPETLRQELAVTLRNLKTDYLDIYQLHQATRCYRPGDGTGMYETLQEFKEKGQIRHIAITTHKIDVAEEIVESGLYETLQYPLNYLSTEREIRLVLRAREKNMGFIAMKGLSGGLLTNARACMAFMQQFDHVLPIWGIQKESELEEWLAFFREDAVMDEAAKAVIAKDREELKDGFCRSCGYCAPCTAGIEIRQCARMSQLIRRSPSAPYLTPEWQAKMEQITDCIGCGVCMTRCPYELNIPELLKKNLEDYRNIVSGKIKL